MKKRFTTIIRNPLTAIILGILIVVSSIGVGGVAAQNNQSGSFISNTFFSPSIKSTSLVDRVVGNNTSELTAKDSDALVQDTLFDSEKIEINDTVQFAPKSLLGFDSVVNFLGNPTSAFTHIFQLVGSSNFNGIAVFGDAFFAKLIVGNDGDDLNLQNDFSNDLQVDGTVKVAGIVAPNQTDLLPVCVDDYGVLTTDGCSPQVNTIWSCQNNTVVCTDSTSVVPDSQCTAVKPTAESLCGVSYSWDLGPYGSCSDAAAGVCSGSFSQTTGGSCNGSYTETAGGSCSGQYVPAGPDFQKVWIDNRPFDWVENLVYSLGKTQVGRTHGRGTSSSSGTCDGCSTNAVYYMVRCNSRSTSYSCEWYKARWTGSEYARAGNAGTCGAIWCGDSSSNTDRVTTIQAHQFKGDYCPGNWLCLNSFDPALASCSGLAENLCTNPAYAGCSWSETIATRSCAGPTSLAVCESNSSCSWSETSSTVSCGSATSASSCTGQNSSACTWTPPGESIKTRTVSCTNSFGQTVDNQFCIDAIGPAPESESSDGCDAPETYAWDAGDWGACSGSQPGMCQGFFTTTEKTNPINGTSFDWEPAHVYYDDGNGNLVEIAPYEQVRGAGDAQQYCVPGRTYYTPRWVGYYGSIFTNIDADWDPDYYYWYSATAQTDESSGNCVAGIAHVVDPASGDTPNVDNTYYAYPTVDVYDTSGNQIYFNNESSNWNANIASFDGDIIGDVANQEQIGQCNNLSGSECETAYDIIDPLNTCQWNSGSTGEQNRPVVCTDSAGDTVLDMFCTQAKPTDSQSC